MQRSTFVAELAGLTLVLSLAFSGKSQSAQAPIEVSAVGQAAIVDNDVPAARDRALDDALRKAVEQAVGTMVESETMTANYQLISDQILSKSRGYVRRYTIEKDGKIEGGIYQVQVKAEVSSGDLGKDVQGILAVLKAKNMPRVLIMISEQNVGQPGASFWWQGASILTNLDAVENAFISTWQPKGISFVDHQALSGKFKNSASVTGAEPGDNAVKEFAGKTGAEIVVIGKAVATDAGPIMGTQMHSLRANISVRALDLDSGRILDAVTTSQVVGHIDPTSGGIQALTKVGEKAAAELLEKMLAQWQKDLGGGATVSISVRNVPKFKQAQDLARALKDKVRGVQAVRQRSYGDKTVELEIDFKGTTQVLANAIEAQKLAGLQIEIEGITGNTVKAAAK